MYVYDLQRDIYRGHDLSGEQSQSSPRLPQHLATLSATPGHPQRGICWTAGYLTISATTVIQPELACATRNAYVLRVMCHHVLSVSAAAAVGTDAISSERLVT